MKNFILFTSDLHYHPGFIVLSDIKDMIDNANELALSNDGKISAIVIAGDIAESVDLFEDCIEYIRKIVDIPILITVGNHDLTPHFDKNGTQKRYDKLYLDICKKYNAIYLDSGEIYKNDDYAILGNVGWYDCTAQYDSVHNLMPPEYWQKRNVKKDLGFIDHYIDWKKTDIEFAKECCDQISNNLNLLSNDNFINDIIVTTHIPVLFKEIINITNRVGLNPVLDLYFHNPNLGKKISEFSKVKMVVSGHIHQFSQCFFEGNNKIYNYTIKSDYRRPGSLLIEIKNYGNYLNVQI